MSTLESPRRKEEARQRAEARLQRAFEDDDLDVGELEQRLGRLHAAADLATIDEVVADLPVEEAAATSSPATTAMVDPAAESRGSAIALLGGTERKGRWTPPRHLRVVAVMGGVNLDFTEALLPPGETTVKAFAMMGGVNIRVPPHVRVEVAGTGLLGGFSHVGQEGEPGGPVLRVTGLAVMGGVDVKAKTPKRRRP